MLSPIKKINKIKTVFRLCVCARGAGLMGVIKGPAPFSGVAEECNGFLLQCSLYIENQPHLYSTERSKVSFLIHSFPARHCSGQRRSGLKPVILTQSFDKFVSHFREVFGRPHGDPTASDQLYHLSPSRSMHWGSERSRLPAVGNERSLITTCRQGLEPRLHLQMASYDDNFGLEDYDPTFHSLLSSRMQSCVDEQTSWNRCTSSYHHPETPFPSRTRIRTHANWGNAVGTRWVAEVTI